MCSEMVASAFLKVIVEGKTAKRKGKKTFSDEKNPLD